MVHFFGISQTQTRTVPRPGPSANSEASGFGFERLVLEPKMEIHPLT